MPRHVCHECGATVSGDEQFCPTCGTFLGYEEEEAGTDEYEHFELGAAPPPGEDPVPLRPSKIVCPSCGVENAPGNRHCEECGARLSQGPLPAAPRPAVQATAGVRAVIAIGGLLLGVILIALVFQLFGGDDPSSTTVPLAESTSSTASPVEVDRLEPLDVECSVEGLGSFICENLISGTDALYQINWPEHEATGNILTITIRFRTAVAVSRIDWHNISNDETRFLRNFRARALTISADDSFSDIQSDLQNLPGVQEIDFSSLNTQQVTITVNSVWNAEIVDENVFTELAIDEIEVIGRPVTGTSAPTDTTGTTGTSETSTPEQTTTPTSAP
ncbi:MAG: zinc-ribbon domain-containing protein [Acidimicrobiia bacterium]